MTHYLTYWSATRGRWVTISLRMEESFVSPRHETRADEGPAERAPDTERDPLPPWDRVTEPPPAPPMQAP